MAIKARHQHCHHFLLFLVISLDPSTEAKRTLSSVEMGDVQGSNSPFLRLHAPATPTHEAHAGSMRKLRDHLCAQGSAVYHLPASGGVLHACREKSAFLFTECSTLHSLRH